MKLATGVPTQEATVAAVPSPRHPEPHRGRGKSDPLFCDIILRPTTVQIRRTIAAVTHGGLYY